MGTIIKLVFETLLGGNMEKAMKHNSGLTLLTALLSAGALYFSWINVKSLEAQSHEIQNIKHAIYYRLDIDVNAPDKPTRDERSEFLKPDAVLTRKDEPTKD